MNILFYGLITGVLFGFLMQRAQVIRYDKQMGAMRLIDMTIVKFMLSAIVVGMIGLYLLMEFNAVQLSIKPTILSANIIGGLIFGAGWGFLGYCPGTALGAVGEGRWDALWGMLGMLFGAAAFAEIYPRLEGTVMSWGNLGKVTIPELLGINPWIVIVVFIAITLALAFFFKKKGL
jgi:uncharacterized membrane protein YedE/YeeE